VNWWPGDGNADDIQGNNNGTLQGGVTFVPGLVGQAFSFNGANGSVSFGNTVGNFGTADFTIDFWIKTTSKRQEGLLGKRPVCGDSSFWDIRLGSGPTSGTPDPGVLGIELDGDEAGTNFNAIRTKARVNDGKFHHAAIVRSGATVWVYVDGQLDTSRTTPGVTDLTNEAVLAAGVSTCTGVDGTQFFDGQLDEIEIFDRALTSSEIASIFNAGSAGKCKGVPFKILTADVTMTSEPQSHQETFKLISRFTTGSDSNGIDPLNEAVSLQVGAFSTTLPAGSFHANDGNFLFNGTIGGVRLQVKIIQLNDRAFQLLAKGQRANLSGTEIPVKVGITIGDDNGNVTLKNTRLVAGSHPLKSEPDDNAEFP
jgi:hypothetical protein